MFRGLGSQPIGMEEQIEKHMRELINLHRAESARGFERLEGQLEKVGDRLTAHTDAYRHAGSVGRAEVYGVLVTLLIAGLAVIAALA